MDLGIHAQLMAQTCQQSFAQIVLEIPEQWHEDSDSARQLIRIICHADTMANTCGPRAASMILKASEKLLQFVEPKTVDLQVTALRRILSLICHADSMARTVPQVTNTLFTAVQRITNSPLPTTQAQLRQQLRQHDAVNGEIRKSCHEAQMHRHAFR